jgi:hypothetical protein
LIKFREHVKVGPALYSVPWRLIGQQVHARSTATMVQIVHDGKVVATHVRRPRGRATNVGHYPPERIAFHMRTPTWCRHAAEEVRPACSAVIATLLEVNALFRLRAAQGVLGLRTRHAPARLEAACAKAIEVGDPSYRTIKGILVAGTETTTAANRSAGWGAGVPAFLHGPRALFEPGSGDDLAPVLELNTGPTTGTGTGPSDEAAQA